MQTGLSGYFQKKPPTLSQVVYNDGHWVVPFPLKAWLLQHAEVFWHFSHTAKNAPETVDKTKNASPFPTQMIP